MGQIKKKKQEKKYYSCSFPRSLSLSLHERTVVREKRQLRSVWRRENFATLYLSAKFRLCDISYTIIDDRDDNSRRALPAVLR